MNTNESAPEAVGLEPAKPRQEQRLKPKRQPKQGGPKCMVPNCGRPMIARNLCTAHYQRWKAHNDLLPTVPIGKVLGPHRPNWKGKEHGDGHGRVLVYAPDHPHPNTCGVYVYRYRLVMEKQLGRYLLPSEIVHHKNGDKSDDRPENLEVLSQSDHTTLHWNGQTKAERGVWTLSGLMACVRCKTNARPHHGNGLCQKCYDRTKKDNLQKLKLQPPTKTKDNPQ